MKNYWHHFVFYFCILLISVSGTANADPPQGTSPPEKPPAPESTSPIPKHEVKLTIEHMLKQAPAAPQEKSQSKDNAPQTLTYDPNGNFLSGSIPVDSDFYITGPLLKDTKSISLVAYQKIDKICDPVPAGDKTTYFWEKKVDEIKTFTILIVRDKNNQCFQIKYQSDSKAIENAISIPSEKPLLSQYLGFDVGAGLGYFGDNYLQHFTFFSVHFFRDAVNKNSGFNGFDNKKRLSLFAGLTLENFNIDKMDKLIRYEGILGNRGVVTGLGIRVFRYGRLSVGGIIFKRKDLLHPSGKNHYRIAPILTLSVDLDLFLYIEKAYRSVTGLFEKK